MAEEQEQDEGGGQWYQVAEEVVVITLIRCGTLNQRPVARDSTGTSAVAGPVPPGECRVAVQEVSGMAPGDGLRPGGKLLDRLKAEAGSLASAARDRAVLSVRQNLGNATSRLARYAESGGGPGLMAAVTGVTAPAGGRSTLRSGTAMRGAARRRAGGSSGPGGRHEGGQARKSLGRRRATGHSRTTTDHEEIRRWVREHGGRPVSVKGTERRGEHAGILRVNFPGSPADESFKTIGWDTFFDKFETSQLAFVYQDATPDGQQSRFGKFVSRRRPR